jgi:hypothetical protein
MSLAIKLRRRRLGLLNCAKGCDVEPAPGLACVEVRAAGSIGVDDGDTSALNAATGAIGVSSAAQVAGAGVAGYSSSAAAVVNSSAASEAARVHLGVRGPIVRSFARRALRLPGTLVNSVGQPIAGASVDVLTRDADSERGSVIAHARTIASGSFVAEVPPGPPARSKWRTERSRAMRRTAHRRRSWRQSARASR